MKVAYYSPLPPERSGIADYSALLLPALERRVDVEVVRRGRRRRPRTDVSLYHVGNNPDLHDWIVEELADRPGVVVLHDFVLQHLVAGMTLGRGNVQGYVRALEAERGLPGRLLALDVVNGTVQPPWVARPEQFPLVGIALEHATAVIVHSRHVADRVRGTGYEGAVRRVPHPAWPAPVAAPAELAGEPVVGCFGHVTAEKRIPQLLAAFARLRRRHPRARLVLAGEVAPHFDLRHHLDREGLARGDAVAVEGYVEADRLRALMAACDVCVNLRAPTMGETSGAAIRALALGRPLIVSDVGWFSELPDDVALKVPVDGWEVATLAAALDLLAVAPDVRAAMSEAALAYVRSEHDVEHVADEYAAALELAAGGDALAETVLGEVAAAAAEVGITAESAELGEVAELVREARIAQ